MTLEELKAEAAKHGYRLIKVPKHIAMLPCTCGHNKRSTWCVDGGYILECLKCGKQGYAGTTRNDARIQWNRRIEEDLANG